MTNHGAADFDHKVRSSKLFVRLSGWPRCDPERDQEEVPRDVADLPPGQTHRQRETLHEADQSLRRAYRRNFQVKSSLEYFLLRDSCQSATTQKYSYPAGIFSLSPWLASRYFLVFVS